ncbi:hypothetical protein D3C75_991120 [compost metagenome]
MARRLHGNVGVVILIQQRQLFFQIGAKQLRTSDSGGVTAWMREARIGAGFRQVGGAAIPGHRKRRIDKEAIQSGLCIGKRSVFNIATDCATQRVYRLLIHRI